MAEVKSVICDMCGAPNAERWAITKRPLKPWVIDLCSMCATPLLSMRENARSGEGSARPYRRLQKTPLKRAQEGRRRQKTPTRE